ncbi:uncharacterized protein LOC116979893 [Amblyraja radiata]|uniref:uncharacterized protein LOC116979893 n=1 Tax=Amblyraja radiata TaxID=386614 RepID=UPI0014028EC9|nr:uncharacterized protein LOC116979893 [Amblyraja radiata]
MAARRTKRQRKGKAQPPSPLTRQEEEEEEEAREGEASQYELTKAATEAKEAILAMTQPETPHERAVDSFLGFYKTELLKIPENMWVDYIMAAIAVAQNFSHPTQQQTVHIGQPQMVQMGPPFQQAHQPQSLMEPPQMQPPLMSCSPMATSPMGRSPSSTGQQHSTSTQSQQLATTSTYTTLQPARSSSFSALVAAFTDYHSLDTPRPAPVSPGGTPRMQGGT